MGALATRVDDVTRSVLAIPKVKQFVERMVEGEALADAAKRSGLRTRRARLLMLNPAVRQAYTRGIENLLLGERARNVKLRMSVRDRGFSDDATAATVRQSLIAADRLDGNDGRSQTSVSVGVNVHSVVGYVMDLREDDDPPPLPARTMIDLEPADVR